MKKFNLLLVLLALLFAFSSPVIAAPEYGGTLIVGLDDDPPILDPYMSTARVDRQVLTNIYVSLVEVNENMEVIPGLTEDWDINNDGKSYI